MSKNLNFRKLNSGIFMPLIGLGTFAATGEKMQQTLRTALECGYRGIDTATLYGNEDAIGIELDKWIAKGDLKREEIFLSSKLPLYGNRKEDVLRFCKKSLKDLKVDYLDLYILHQPFGILNKENDDVDPNNPEDMSRIDYDTDFISVWKEMEKLVDDGLTKAIGISNFNEEQIHRLVKSARIIPAMLQIESNVYMQQVPLRKVCEQYGIAITAYGPLGAPYRHVPTDDFPLLIENETVTKIAKSYGKTPAQILLKFLLQIDILIIPKSATPSRLRENLELFDFCLTDQDMKKLKQLDRGEDGRVLNFIDIYVGCVNHKEYPFRKPA